MLEQRDRLEEQLEKIRKKLKTSEKKRHEREEMAQDFTVQLRDRLMDHKKKWDEVGVELEDRQKERQTMMGESKEVEQELEDIKDLVEELKDDLDKINQYDLEFDCKSVESLEDLISDATKDINIVSGQVKELKKESDRLHDTLEDEQDELADVEDEKHDIREEEGRIISKCQKILKDYREKFNLKDYAKMAAEGGKGGRGLGSWFSRKAAPMSNEKKGLCKETIKDVQDIMECVTRDLHPNNIPKSSSSRPVNLQLRSYIMTHLTQVGDNIVTLNEMLINKFNDLGTKDTYDVMRYLEEELDLRNQKLMKEGRDENMGELGQHKELEEELRQLRSERAFTEQCLTTFNSQLVAYRDESAKNQKRLEKIRKKKRLLGELRMTKQELLDDVREADDIEKTAQNRIKKSRAMFWDSVRGSQQAGGRREKERRGSADSRSRTPPRGGPSRASSRRNVKDRVYTKGEISESESEISDSVNHRERERTPRRTEPTRHPKRVPRDDRDYSKSPPPPVKKHRPSDSRYSFETEEDDDDVRNRKQKSQNRSSSPPRRRGKDF